jgi:hypothetical protein
VATIEEFFDTYRDRLLASATRVWGDPATLDADSAKTAVVPRYPDGTSHDLVLKIMLTELSKTRDIFREMAIGNEFWQETSRKHEAAADYWRHKYETLTSAEES